VGCWPMPGPTIALASRICFWCANNPLSNTLGRRGETRGHWAREVATKRRRSMGPVRPACLGQQFGLAGPPWTRLGMAKTASIQHTSRKFVYFRIMRHWALLRPPSSYSALRRCTPAGHTQPTTPFAIRLPNFIEFRVISNSLSLHRGKSAAARWYAMFEQLQWRRSCGLKGKRLAVSVLKKSQNEPRLDKHLCKIDAAAAGDAT